MNLKLREKIRSDVIERDVQERTLADVLDVKASILLVLIVFLVEQTNGIVEKAAGVRFVYIAQFISGLSLIGAGCLVVLALWPASYRFPAPAQNLVDWAEAKEKELGESSEDAVLAQYEAGSYLRALERANTNHRLNRKKADYVKVAFRLSALALTLNIMCVLRLVVG